ncbi:MAG: hypothetical protein V8T87_16040 [Victivallales bacterium]
MISSIHPKRFAGGIHPESEGKELSAGQPIRIPPLLENTRFRCIRISVRLRS